MAFHSEKNFPQWGREVEALPFCSEAQIKKKTKCAISKFVPVPSISKQKKDMQMHAHSDSDKQLFEQILLQTSRVSSRWKKPWDVHPLRDQIEDSEIGSSSSLINATAGLGVNGSEPAYAITPAIYPWKEVAEAERVIIATGVRVEYGGQRPAYIYPLGDFPHHHAGDFIRMPNRQLFHKASCFYLAIFHELVHWTERRLGWQGHYALGEVIAELGACLLAKRVNAFDPGDLSNQAAYIKRWCQDLPDIPDPMSLALSQSQKAVDYIQHVQWHD